MMLLLFTVVGANDMHYVCVNLYTSYHTYTDLDAQ